MQLGHRDVIWHRKDAPYKLRKEENDTLQTEWNYQIKKKIERSEKRKPTNTRGYWKLTPSNKMR